MPETVGVPVIAPDVEPNDKPPGRAPDVTVQLEYGDMPPAAFNVCEYGVPTPPSGKGLGVLIDSAAGGLIVRTKAFEPVRGVPGVLSCTSTVKLNVPAAAGEPANTPVVGLSVSPPGKAPAMTNQFE